MNFNRRNLLKGGAAAVASLPFASAIAKPYSKDFRWDKETDVLVVGYGGAGACAAITAHDAGAKVLCNCKEYSRGGEFLTVDRRCYFVNCIAFLGCG